MLISSFRPTVLKKKHIARAVTMKISSIAASLLAAASTGTVAGVQAFVSSPASARCAGQPNIRLSSLSMSSNGPDDDMLKASAEQMKNMQPEDIDRMMAEMESMGPAQKVGWRISCYLALVTWPCALLLVAPPTAGRLRDITLLLLL